jgi:tetratricopeptide (TPR) repeat protein
MNKNPFKREISDIDKSQVEKILNEFDLIKIDRSLPSIQELMKQISSDTCWEGERYQELVEIDNAILNLVIEGDDYNNNWYKSYIFAFAVKLYELTMAREIPVEASSFARKYFEMALVIDKEYYQAYNRLGDCWIYVNSSEKEAIGCYKAALKYHGKGRNSTVMFQNSGDNFLLGDNYFKIGMCLQKLGREDDSILFIAFAQQYVEEDDYLYAGLGFNSWEDVYGFIEYKRNERINKETLVQEILKGIELKRVGEFQRAISLYSQLNAKYPDTAMIFKSWAKVLVCLGQYDEAIAKYYMAIKLFDEEGDESESWQCNDQIKEIKNRFSNPTKFRQWVSAISGGSISPNES